MKIVVEHLENLIRIPSVSSLQEAHCSPFSDVGTNQPKSPKNPRACYELRSQWDCITASLGVPPRGVLDRKSSEFNDLDGAIAAKSSF